MFLDSDKESLERERLENASRGRERLAGDYLYGKLLFTWLSMVMSLMASVCAVLFSPRGVLDEI